MWRCMPWQVDVGGGGMLRLLAYATGLRFSLNFLPDQTIFHLTVNRSVRVSWVIWQKLD